MNQPQIHPELDLNPPPTAEERLAHLEQVEHHMHKIQALCLKHGFAYDSTLLEFLESRLAGQ
jgi:hypothetical protein